MNSAQLLGSNGPLAELLDGYQPREEQQTLATAIEDAIADDETLVAEAGTGTGKTFAYLIPALISGKRTIVSTGTKALQDQLFDKDLPLVRKALKSAAKVALLKGRANYLCLYRWDVARTEGRFSSKEVTTHLSRISEWAGRTRDGDVVEVSDVPEDSPVWPRVTSNAENCLGSECPNFDDCFVVKARRNAQEADLVVVNHHLLMADLALRDTGFGELLPGADTFIIDEAHQIPDVASQFFGNGISSRQCLELSKDIDTLYRHELSDTPELEVLASNLKVAAQKMREAFGAEQSKGPWADKADDPNIQIALDDVDAVLAQADSELQQFAERSPAIGPLVERAQGLSKALAEFLSEDESEFIRWYETHLQTVTLRLTPMDVAGALQKRMSQFASSWVFTSATLAVGDSFNHFCHQVGLYEPATLKVDSPFEYAKQAYFYVPPDMPEPNSPNYTEAVVEAALPLLRANRGRAFMLFTSHRALQLAAELMEHRLEHPLLVQGYSSRRELLEKFRELEDPVLLGTQSFWEGIDVRGRDLTLVIIDKLPFASPGEPVMQARIDAIKERGGNAFFEHQLPNAVITLKQGVGRLIRDASDRGVLSICDPRLLSKSYGKVFINSLPPMAKTRDGDKVAAYLNHLYETEQ